MLSRQNRNRLKSLEAHLKKENPVLIEAIKSFRQLDRIAIRMGLLSPGDSFATQIPWWPMVSVLGTFSSGKSTFINHFLETSTQRTGTQAVDDKFTVICYSHDGETHSLPGIALDADPRFPFYQMSRDIEDVAAGEGKRIDSYLQLTTCPSEAVKGKIIIDSPGFDADSQRTSTLRITDHIIDLSDLVLVFFDARHPEPGAMRDTLEHLVANTIKRSDSTKFLYILNQIDTTAREDNPEEVVAAWQRALGEQGLTAGRFFCIYNPDAAVPIEDQHLRVRFETKRDHDLAEIHQRIQQLEVERAYRIVGAIEQTATGIEERMMPELKELIRQWKKRVLLTDMAIFGALAGLGIWQFVKQGLMQSSNRPEWMNNIINDQGMSYIALSILTLLCLAIHFSIRMKYSAQIAESIRKRELSKSSRFDLAQAFTLNTRPWRSIFNIVPMGWSERVRHKLKQSRLEADQYVQKLNDKFTNPSGTEKTGLFGAKANPNPQIKD